MPDIPLGERWCLGGRTDTPLGAVGLMQAALLGAVPELRTVSAVFCSRLIRSRQTALPLCADPIRVAGLEEQDMGVWDGLSFTQIRQRYPELYAAREADPSLLPEGAESLEQVAARMQAALLSCLEQSTGDIAVVSHKSAIASLVGHRSELGYTSISVLETDGAHLRPSRIAWRAHPPLTEALCLELLPIAGADEALIAHCRAVADLADELCLALLEQGILLDRDMIHAAALLHDIARAHPEHPALGAAWLRELGYPAEAEIVRQHHDPDSTALNEAALVFLADKAVRGAERVSLTERFDRSAAKCRTPEAAAAHARRRAAAEALRDRVNTLCGRTLIP